MHRRRPSRYAVVVTVHYTHVCVLSPTLQGYEFRLYDLMPIKGIKQEYLTCLLYLPVTMLFNFFPVDLSYPLVLLPAGLPFLYLVRKAC